jgi:hypothetical protein
MFFLKNSILKFILKWTKIVQKIHCAMAPPAQWLVIYFVVVLDLDELDN